jgi:transcriptional regulator with XRE-family HTH domain
LEEVLLVPTRHSPTLPQRRLARELRSLREATGLTVSEAATKLYFSPSKLSRIETAQVGVSMQDVENMLKYYEVGGQRREILLRVARAAQQKKAWWHDYGDVSNVWTFLSYEDEATTIRSFEALVVPGLLQTEDYARAMITKFVPGLLPNEIERHVKVRMARQLRLTATNPPMLWVILDEAVLRRLVGSRSVMRRQLKRLIAAADMPNIRCQVLRFDAGEHVGLTGAFTIFTYLDPVDTDVVFFEHTAGEVYLDSPDEVSHHVRQFENLGAVALPPRDSAVLLNALAKEW